MTDRTTFDESALAQLPGASADVERRLAAYGEFVSLPVPSHETEEWRYTDLSTFDLDFSPFTPGARAADLDDVPAEVLAAAGAVGERAGLQIQHNSTVMMTHLDPALAAKGVLFCDLDEAVDEHPELVERHLHRLVPTNRTKFTALNGAFRTGGTFLYVPPDVSVALPLQTFTYLDADGAAVFPHTLMVVDRGAEVTFIDRFASPTLGRAFSDAITEIHVGDGAHVRYVSLQDWGDGVTHLGVAAGRRWAATPRSGPSSIGFGADLCPGRERGGPRGARRVLSEHARGVLRRR